MRCLARSSLALLGLAMVAPTGVRAQDVASSAPAGYQPAAAVATGLDGKPLPAPTASAPAPAPVAVAHQHTGKVLCARCAAKQASAKAPTNAMPPGVIVGCEHSRNGVCTACRAALNLPGQFVVMGGPAPVAEAPGRAVASSDPKPSTSRMASRKAVRPSPGVVVAQDNGPSGDPVPVGVVQTNYSPGGPAPMAPYPAGPSQKPGRAVAESTAGHEPYQPRTGTFPHPHVIAHIFGFSGHGTGWAEEQARRKAKAHAAIAYENGNESAPVTDLPASAVYGKK